MFSSGSLNIASLRNFQNQKNSSATSRPSPGTPPLDTNKAEGKYVTGLDLTLCDFIPGGPTPDQYDNARKRLADSLEQLGPEERRLVDLLMQGLSLEEMASQLDISYANAAVRIHRLRGRILNRLKTKEL
jgi:RNA polymerase sigma factor (sigma-70 family)